MSIENSSEEQSEQNPAALEDTQSAETAEASEALEAKEGETKDATDSDEEQADEQKEEQEQPKAKKPGFAKRIDKLTRKNADLAREKEYWREQALKSQTQTPAESSAKAPLKAEGLVEPDPEKFDTNADYMRAVARYEYAVAKQQDERATREKELKSSIEKKWADYGAKARAFAKENPEFNDAVAEADAALREHDLLISFTVEDALLEYGPELSLELSKDPEALVKLVQMPPLRAAETIGKVLARMESAKADPKPQIKLTNAPKPPTPIASKSAPLRKSIGDPDLSFAEYVRLRRDSMRKKA